MSNPAVTHPKLAYPTPPEAGAQALPRAQYTTFQAGRILAKTAQTVINYCDRGWIKSERIARGPRKIKHADLIAFMQANNLAWPAGEAAKF